MLRILGAPSTTCDGVTRRDLMKVGALSLAGLTLLPPAARASTGRARSIILLDLFGGPSHLDTFDPKPAAPAEIRGPFKTIPTSLSGVLVAEHLPRLARLMHRMTLIRTITHGYNSHNPYGVMTGFTGGNDREDYFAKPSNWPSMGSVCQYFGVGRRADLPSYVCLPAFPGYSQGLRRAGPYGGFLGNQYDPLFATVEVSLPRAYDPNKDFYDPTLVPMGEPRLPSPAPGMTLDALDRRRTLLQQIDAARGGAFEKRREQAFDLLLSATARKAFDLAKEPPAVRDRYGRDVFGSSVLLARRLVEAGVTFVTVHTEAKGAGHWDTHENNFNMLKGYLLPFLDRALATLLEELADRGLLETTLVVVTGDMGRTPRINAKAGRDHWPQCGFCLLIGGGVKAGYVHGTSDKTGAFPASQPVSPGDLVATIYQLLGVDPEATIPDRAGRPMSFTHGGSLVRAILA